MRRVRLAEQVELAATTMTDDQQAALLAEVDRRLALVRAAIDIGRVTVVGQVPPEGDALSRLGKWLGHHPRTESAPSPRVG